MSNSVTIRPVGAGCHADRRLDGRDEAESCFSRFLRKAPETQLTTRDDARGRRGERFRMRSTVVRFPLFKDTPGPTPTFI